MQKKLLAALQLILKDEPDTIACAVSINLKTGVVAIHTLPAMPEDEAHAKELKWATASSLLPMRLGSVRNRSSGC